MSFKRARTEGPLDSFEASKASGSWKNFIDEHYSNDKRRASKPAEEDIEDPDAIDFYGSCRQYVEEYEKQHQTFIGNFGEAPFAQWCDLQSEGTQLDRMVSFSKDLRKDEAKWSKVEAYLKDYRARLWAGPNAVSTYWYLRFGTGMDSKDFLNEKVFHDCKGLLDRRWSQSIQMVNLIPSKDDKIRVGFCFGTEESYQASEDPDAWAAVFYFMDIVLVEVPGIEKPITVEVCPKPTLFPFPETVKYYVHFQQTLIANSYSFFFHGIIGSRTFRFFQRTEAELEQGSESKRIFDSMLFEHETHGVQLSDFFNKHNNSRRFQFGHVNIGDYEQVRKLSLVEFVKHLSNPEIYVKI